MTLVDAVRAAREAGLQVLLSDLGASQKRPILAEYDPRRRTIAVNARIARTLSNERGESFARRFVAFAIAHELHHHRSGSGDERAAHRAARAACGDDVATFEAAIRALAPR
jgi:hypothetical protein